ncbi:MAG TPA: AraC family transcriptional regulator [Actinopolymorphaceae bacterium]|jgi:AraC-like DNA-binding protein
MPSYDTPLQLLGGGMHVAGRGRDFPLHAHGSWELVYYVRGRARCSIGEEWYDGTPGTILLTPPYTRHAEYTDGGYTNRFLQVDAPAAWQWPRLCYDDGDRTIGRLFDALTHEIAHPGPDHKELVRLLLAELDLRVRRARDVNTVSEAESLVVAAERLVDERFGSRLKIADIARELGVSQSTLRAHYARIRGTTLRAYMHGVRLRHAIGYLRNSTLTLQAIAELTGYDSVSHLSRHVKKATGQSPGRIRTAARSAVSGGCAQPDGSARDG